MSGALEITPLDAPLGAEVKGLRIDSPLSETHRQAIIAALDAHLLLLFRNEALPSPLQISDFCGHFGPFRPTLADRSRFPDFPGINRISNRDADGVMGTGGHDVVTWHSDLSFEPPLIEFIYLDAVELPSQGGTTRWSNCVAAYEALPPALRKRIDALAVEYRLRDGLDFVNYFKAADPDEAMRDRTRISLVQTNPRNGRKSVWPNKGPDFAADVIGLSPEEGNELLSELLVHTTQERFVYEHTWQVGESMLWLNTQTLHQREPFPADELRVLRHINILGVADPQQAVPSRNVEGSP